MTKLSVACLGFLLGAAIASCAWCLFRNPPPQTIAEAIPATPDTRALDALQGKLDEVARMISQDAALFAPVASRVPDEPDRVADVLARLTAIEAALTNLRRQVDDLSSAGLSSRVPPKEKDKDLVDRVASKGKGAPGENARDYWGWSPRDVYQTFGKPDATLLVLEGGSWIDWSYWNAEKSGTTLRFRFESGVVIGVWP